MARKSAEKERKGLLTISEACQVMGVSEAALRQWTDEGKVKAFITPGGHRRYQEAELREMMHRYRHVHGLKDLGDRLGSVVGREREVALQHMSGMPWYHRLDEGARDRFRERGRRLVDALARFVARPSSRDQVMEECRAIGREYGHDLAKTGLCLADALEAFIAHRTPISEATMEMLQNSAPMNKPALAAIGQINRVIDETLIALVQTHHQVWSEQSGDSQEATI